MRTGANIVVFDIETGGFNPDKNPLVEVYFSCYDTITFEKVSSYEAIVSPYYEHPKTKEPMTYTDAAMRVHGISIIEMGIKGKLLSDVLKEILQYLKDCKTDGRHGKPFLVGHNEIGFDISFLDTCMGWYNINWLNEVNPMYFDTMHIARLIWPQISKDNPDSPVKNHQLITCCEAMGIQMSSVHRAADDVDANARMVIEMIKRMRGEGMATLVKTDIIQGKPYLF